MQQLTTPTEEEPHRRRTAQRIHTYCLFAAVALGLAVALLWGGRGAPVLAAPAAQATPTSSAITTTCTTLMGLNLRKGPGTTYTVIVTLAKGTQLKQLARTTNNWLQVETIPPNATTAKQSGYVNGAAQYITCTTAAGPANNSAPPVTQTSRRVITPPSGGDITGRLAVDADLLAQGLILADDDEDTITFKRAMWLKAVPDDASVAIDQVYFYLAPDDPNSYGGEMTDENAVDAYSVYTRTERTAGYCLFGGGEPDCNSVSLGEGATWPGRGTPIYNGAYRLRIEITPTDDSNGTSNWRDIVLIIDSPALDDAPVRDSDSGDDSSGDTPPDLEVELWETGPGTDDDFISGALNFRVAAWDPAVGDNDGDGIDSVTLQVINDTGEVVHERTERTAGYCAFGGGEPDCNTYIFADHDHVWDDTDIAITSGFYTLRATVTADDGRTATYEWTVSGE